MTNDLFTKQPIEYQTIEDTPLAIFTDLGHQRAYRTGQKTNWRNNFYILYRAIINFCYGLWRYWLIDGFIERQMRQWLKRYAKEGLVLDVGIGDGRLMRHVPTNCHYLGFDVFIRETLVKQANKRGQSVLFVASATDLPLPDESVDFLLSTEVMEHIDGYKQAIKEMHRVARPKAKLLLSIPNNYCFKYHRKGPHPEHVNNWRYREFIDELAPYFRVIEGRMTGWWLPWFPHIRYSYQIGWSHPDEYYNTNFLFVFEKVK